MNNEKALQLAKSAPSLSASEIDAINATFQAYIFRVRRKREVWTTCCGRHEVIPKGEISADVAALFDAEHHSEPKQYPQFGCHIGHMSSLAGRPREPEPIKCPYCGTMAKVKELGRTGKRDNLEAYGRAAVFRWYKGSLWATAYSTKKVYAEISALTDKPKCDLARAYRFKLGKASHAAYSWYRKAFVDFVEITGSIKKLPIPIPEPFGYNGDFGVGYGIVGAKEIQKSPFRWCGFEEYRMHSGYLLKFLSVCSIYPRQVEMLMKAGMHEAVADLVNGRKKNTAAFSWDEVNPIKAFGLAKAELDEFLSGNKNLDCLAKYKQFKRANLPCTFEELTKLHRDLNAVMFQRVSAKLKKYKLQIKSWQNYIERVRKAVQGRKKNAPSFTTVAEWWNDYISAAEILGLDLKNQIVLLPKDLKEKHDKASASAAAILEQRRTDEERMLELALMPKLTKRYTYSNEQWLIRPPLGAAEIRAEGKALKHCVWQYADDHVKGRKTFLFLRDRKNPTKPLVTIEMRGDQLVQIHGYDDERSACKENPKRLNPRDLYAEFLEPWLAWVADGSKRDKKGRPKIPKNKEMAVA